MNIGEGATRLRACLVNNVNIQNSHQIIESLKQNLFLTKIFKYMRQLWRLWMRKLLSSQIYSIIHLDIHIYIIFRFNLFFECKTIKHVRL